MKEQEESLGKKTHKRKWRKAIYQKLYKIMVFRMLMKKDIETMNSNQSEMKTDS